MKFIKKPVFRCKNFHCGLADGIRKISLIHGRMGKCATKTGSQINSGSFFHKIASGVHKTGRSVFDHLKGCKAGTEAHFFRSQSALKRQHDPGPDHRKFIQNRTFEKLLSGMHMAIHKTWHPQEIFPVDDFCDCKTGRFFFSDGKNDSVLNGDENIAPDLEVFIQDGSVAD